MNNPILSIMRFLSRLLKWEEAPVAPSTPLPAPISNITATPPAPTSPPETTSTVDTVIAPKATTKSLCEAIKQYEGWILPGGKDWAGKVYPKGSRSFQNCSPGNVRFSPVGYLPVYEPVLKDKDGFAKFKDVATGTLYLENMVKVKIHAHPDRSISEFFYVYAPPSENDSAAYARFAAKYLGVSIDFKVGDLV